MNSRRAIIGFYQNSDGRSLYSAGVRNCVVIRKTSCSGWIYRNHQACPHDSCRVLSSYVFWEYEVISSDSAYRPYKCICFFMQCVTPHCRVHRWLWLMKCAAEKYDIALLEKHKRTKPNKWSTARDQTAKTIHSYQSEQRVSPPKSLRRIFWSAWINSSEARLVFAKCFLLKL